MKTINKGVIETLVGHVELFQKHPHPVVRILVKGFSNVLVRSVFAPILRRVDGKKCGRIPPVCCPPITCGSERGE